MLPRHSSPVSAAQLRSAMIATVREGLGYATLAMGVAFVILAIASFFLGFGAVAPWLAAIEIASAASVLAVRWLLWRIHVPDRFVYPLVIVVGGVALARCLTQLYVWHNPQDTMNLVLLLGGLSLLSLSFAWSALLVGATWIGWFAIALWVDPREAWTPYGFFLMWATVLGAAVQYARQKLRTRLVQAEARYQVMVEHLPVISYLDDLHPNGKPIYISPQVQSVLGYSADDWLASHSFWRDCLYPADREITVARMREHIVQKSGWDLEYRMIAKDGRIVWIQDRTTHIETSHGEFLSYGVIVDVTPRKRAELIAWGGNRVLQHMAAGEPLVDVLEALLHVCEDATVESRGMLLLFDSNKVLRNAVIPRLPSEFVDAVLRSKDPQALGPYYAAVERGESIIVNDIATDSPWPAHNFAALEAGLNAWWVEPIISHEGQALGVLALYSQQQRISRLIDARWIESTARLATLAIERSRAADHLTRHREQLEQLVDERTRQLEASLGQLRHAERLASVGTLAAGIAHEINNPVGMILLSAEQALMVTADTPQAGKVGELLRDIVANAKRCGRIVKNVLRFARQEPAERWPDDVNAVVQHAVELTKTYVARCGGELKTRLANPLSKVMLNPIELEQVFVNLICNALEAADKAPSISISSEQADGVVRVSVCDNGRGISRDDRSRIFDPFYTTRQADGGTGLGLSLAYGIVTDHGGTIRVDGIEAGGTRMVVELPSYLEESSAASR
ncbi:MAG TPA: ATP-binding protein [Pirellulales bacterium]|jgi:PAS domain S-box-containing protein